MSIIPTIIICPEEQATNMSVVWEAMDQGPDVFLHARLLCGIDPEATPSTPPTHRLINDAGMPVAIEEVVRKMAAGEVMPQVDWSQFVSQSGVQITEYEAIAAVTSITVISTAGAMAGSASVAELIAVYGLQFVPDLPI